jgi:TetR/AcrR family transcriptional regulator
MRDNRREQILSAAVKLFATRGLAATRVTDIAAAVGMSQGLLYHYFPAKEDIYVEIIRLAFERMNTAARELEWQPIPAREKLALAASQILRGLEESEDFAWFSTLISLASVSDAVPAEAKRIIRREREVPYEMVARIMRAGQKDGTIKKHDAQELALVFWTTVKGLALHKAAYGPSFKSPSPTVLTSNFFEE